jgi:MFS-type transporter involved in bile tolerance (Atg22 family)
MAIIVGQITHFSAQQQTLMGVIFGLTNLIGCLCFYYLSERFNLTPKTTLIVLAVLDGLIAVYGCIGVNPDSTLGFKTVAEIWVYCCWGFFFGPTL